MDNIAIDVVLIPSKEMVEVAIGLNQELLKHNDPIIQLHREKCVPHISLCMGVVKEEDLPVITDMLQMFSKDYNTILMKALSCNPAIIPNGKTVSGLIIEESTQLQSIHMQIINGLWPYLSYNVSLDMLYDYKNVDALSLYWIKNYKQHYQNPNQFHAHITIGFGEIESTNFPMEFSSSTLSLYQLGNFCTCERKIWSTILNDQ